MAYSETINITTGDTRPELVFTLKDSGSAASGATLDEEDSSTWGLVNLTSGVVKLRLRKLGTTTVLSTLTAALTNASSGVCTFTFPTGTWATSGVYEGEIEFTASNGGIQTVNDLIKFNVRSDFD